MNSAELKDRLQGIGDIEMRKSRVLLTSLNTQLVKRRGVNVKR
jgi:hypothetical protein